MNEKTVLEIVKKHISTKINKIERCSVGHGNYVYIISDKTDKYVVRCSNENNAYTNTIYWLKQLKKMDILVPEVIANGKYQNYNYVILSYLGGEDLGIVYPTLSNEEKHSIAREVVRIQNAVSAIEVEKIEDNWTWNSFIQYMLERAKERIEKNGYFDINKVEQLWKMGETLQDYFYQIKPIAYLDDISTKNLLIENGEISGIIDVDWIGIGDKLTYVALSNVALLNMDYDTDYIDYLLGEMKISQIEKKAFIYYSLLYCVDFMGERGMQFGDKRIDVNELIISRLNKIYDNLMIEWNYLTIERRERMIRLAEIKDLENVLQITSDTISQIYSHYYAKGVVDFFLEHHSRENVLSDIENGIVWLLEEYECMVGTVTIKGNAVNRLFVLPEYQSRGYGSQLMDFAEAKIAENFSCVHIDSSLAAKEMYLKRGYKEKRTCRILADHGDILIYDEMEKRVNNQQDRMDYNGKVFIPQHNTENGEVDAETVFHYFQENDSFWAEYGGGEVLKGHMIGIVADNGELDFYYQHLNRDGQVRIGKCHSIPHILENGKIELQEEWQWLNGDLSSGESVVIEK